MNSQIQFFPAPAKPVTVDSVPTSGSTNAVSSGGVYDALATKAALSPPITTVTASTTLTNAHGTVLVNAPSNADVFLSLPAASGSAGRVYVIKKIDSQAGGVFLTTTGDDLIEGGTEYQVAESQNQFLTVQSDGVGNWWIVGF